MLALSASQIEEVSGGFSWGSVIGAIKAAYVGAQLYGEGIGAVGQTLSNYYGQETTLEIINGGNLGA